MRSARWVVLSVALAAPPLSALSREAGASVSIAVTFDALVRASSAVVVGTAVEQRSVWEGGRISTYSRVHVDSKLAGARGELEEGGEAWVRTMGGVVGKVGQIVDGEAVLTVGRPSLVFLHRSTMDSAPDAPYVVTARAQGQFGLYTEVDHTIHVMKSSAVGALLSPGTAGTPPQGASGAAPSAAAPLAADMIHGRAVVDAARDIAAAWSRAHAP